MNMHLDLDSLNFQGVALTVIDHGNAPCVTAPDLARALGYARPDDVARLYRRNADEFTPTMTFLVRLDQGSQRQNGVVTPAPAKQSLTRIFSLRGAHLIAMFARTAVAAEFRRWVLDLIERAEALPGERQPGGGTEWTRDQIDELNAKNTTVRNAIRARGASFGRAVWVELQMPSYRLLGHALESDDLVLSVSPLLAGREEVTAEELGEELGLPGDHKTRVRIGNALRALGWHSRKARRGQRVVNLFMPIGIDTDPSEDGEEES